jgi:hypothetical protein
VSVKVTVFAPTFVTEAKFVQVAPWHLSIRKAVSFDELSCHWRKREVNDIVVTVRLLGGLGGAEGPPAAAKVASFILVNWTPIALVVN